MRRNHNLPSKQTTKRIFGKILAVPIFWVIISVFLAIGYMIGLGIAILAVYGPSAFQPTTQTNGFIALFLLAIAGTWFQSGYLVASVYLGNRLRERVV